ncbi:MAG: ABC transporter permease [Treponema sp.]|nr:ABC transporter permease [Treponema sp.]
MNKKSNFFSRFKWIFSVSRRFARVDRKGRSAVTSILSTAGICFGVMTLTVVMSIMNGFQMSFIDAIMEISSYHVRVTDLEEDSFQKVYSICAENKNILSITEFYEAQTLMTGARGKESAAIIRAVDPEIFKKDSGLKKEMHLVNGTFDIPQENTIILGSSLARNLGVQVGDSVNLFVLSGGNDVDLFSSERNFKVAGIFTCGYSDINQSYSFVNLASAKKYFGDSAKKIFGLKIKNSNDDVRIIHYLEKRLPQAKILSWREYNKAFFGALRIEKNILLLLVAMIFVVVGINIYNGMRRLVYERRSEIAIFSAIGAKASDIKSIFITRGFTSGAIGAMTGVVLGLLISVNSQFVFNAASSLMFYAQYFVTALFSPQNLSFVQENSTYALYANIPARIFFSEVVMIALFGFAAPLFASWMASRSVLKMTVAEVLHDE